MSDIVERLDRPVDSDDPNLWEVDRDRRDAKVEIERLQATVIAADREIKASHADADRLRAEIVRLKAVILGFTGHFVTLEMRRAALEGK